MSDVRAVLEWPADRGTEYASWPENVLRLYIVDAARARGKEKQRRSSLFASWICRILPPTGWVLYAHPLPCLISEKKMRRVLESGQFDDEVVCLQEWYWIIPCATQNSVEHLLRQSGFERLVFFSARAKNEAVDLVQEAGLRSTLVDDRLDTPFLRFCGTVGGFIFYSYTHDNLEVVGNRAFIVDRCIRIFAEKWKASEIADAKTIGSGGRPRPTE